MDMTKHDMALCVISELAGPESKVIKVESGTVPRISKEGNLRSVFPSFGVTLESWLEATVSLEAKGVIYKGFSLLPSVKCREMQWKLNSVEVAAVGVETWIQLSTGRGKHVFIRKYVFFGENNQRELGHRDPLERLCVVTCNTNNGDRARQIGQQGVVGGERPWPVAPGEPLSTQLPIPEKSRWWLMPSPDLYKLEEPRREMK